MKLGPVLLLAGLVTVSHLRAQAAAGDKGGKPLAIQAARFLVVSGDPVDSGVMIVKDGKILALGPRTSVPVPQDAEVRDLGELWVSPGFVDLHHHVSAGGGDINDMQHPINAELRTLDTIKPTARLIRRTVSGGVTTTLFIPGSGTNISGFGVLMKMVPDDFEHQIVREIGAMKVAQGFNPERRNGDMGATRMGSSWLLTKTLLEAKQYALAWHLFEQGKGQRPTSRPDLEQLRLVADKKVPVLIHTAGARDIAATARMFQDVFDVWMILSHGCFNGHWAAICCAKRKTPVNLGPRNYEFRDSEFVGIPRTYWDAGVRDMSLNTDAPVVAPEQLQLQGAMAARLGLEYEPTLKALTLVPARQVGLADRVGSLEAGKDADLQVTKGDPLDPRNSPELVFIEGRLVYRKGDVR